MNRAAAGVAAAAVTGAAAGVFIYGLGRIDGSSRQATVSMAFADAAFILGNSILFGAIIGALPGILVMCFSRAKTAPWNSLLILCIGATLGFVMAYLTVYPSPMIALQNASREALFYTLAIVLPTAGGVGATLLLRPRKPTA